MRQQTLRALDEADLVVFVVDAREGITAVDAEVAKLLRKAAKPVLLAANKVDSEHGRGGRRGGVPARIFRGLPGLRQPRPRRERAARRGGREAAQGARAGAAVRAAAAASGHRATRPAAPLRLAFVGKPNVGKSSLVNCLLGEERVLVHDEPGTTRDPIDTPFSFAGREYVLVDTAGMRRRRSIDTLTEHVAAKMARDQLERCDVAALVVDAREGATAEDARLASLIEDSGRGALVVLNKKDLVGRAEIDARIEATREALDLHALRARAGDLGGHAGRRDRASCREAARVFEQASRRVPTGELNQLFEEIVARHPPPAGAAGRHVRLYYATQAGVRPPTFFVSTNHPTEIGFAYRRFLMNQLRKAYGFEGTPDPPRLPRPPPEGGGGGAGRAGAQKIFETRSGHREPVRGARPG